MKTSLGQREAKPPKAVLGVVHVVVSINDRMVEARFDGGRHHSYPKSMSGKDKSRGPFTPRFCRFTSPKARLAAYRLPLKGLEPIMKTEFTTPTHTHDTSHTESTKSL